MVLALIILMYFINGTKTNVISTILNNNLNENCAYFIYDNTQLPTNIEKLLIPTQTPIVTLKLNEAKFLLRKESECNQYIILIKNLENLDTEINVFYDVLKPWTQLICISTSTNNITIASSSFLTRAFKEKGIRVIIIRLTKNYDAVVNDYGVSTPKFSTPVTILLFNCPPYVIFKDNQVKGGIEIEIIKDALKNQPVRYEMPPDDKEDGGLWLKSAEMVAAGKKDMTICSRWPINSINKTLDFTKSIHQFCITFLVKKPTLMPDSFFMYQAFETPVIILNLLSIIVTFFMLVLLSKLYKSNIDYGLHLLNVLRILSAGSILIKNIYKSYSAKMVLLLWLYFNQLFATYYSAGITSLLTKPRVMNVVDTLQDMVNNKITWKLSVDVYQKEFAEMGVAVYKELSKLYVKGKRIEDRTPTSAIFVKLIDKLYVNDIYTLPKEDQKYYKALSECIAHYESVMFLKKYSPLTKIFNKVISKYVESGIGNQLLRSLIDDIVGVGGHESFFTNYVDNIGPTNIGLSKLVGPIVVLLSGYLLSFAVLLLEIRCIKYQENY